MYFHVHVSTDPRNLFTTCLQKKKLWEQIMQIKENLILDLIIIYLQLSS